jgi:hypothetical protein
LKSILKIKIMEIIGKLIKKLAPVTGEGKNGTWKKQSFVIETQTEFPKQICFTVWGDKVDFNSITETDIVKVHFDIESREYNNNWYTDLKSWKVDLTTAGGGTSGGGTAPSMNAPAFSEKDIPFTLEDDPGDDLPF